MTPNSQSLKDKLSPGERQRLSGLLKTAQAELRHLQQTDQRLFGRPFSPEGLVIHLEDIDFSERVDAFVARFGRLQDLLGDNCCLHGSDPWRRALAQCWKIWTELKGSG